MKLNQMINRIIGNWWIVRKCEFPFPKGYATYNPAKKTILDTGLTKKQAQDICDTMNKEV